MKLHGPYIQWTRTVDGKTVRRPRDRFGLLAGWQWRYRLLGKPDELPKAGWLLIRRSLTGRTDCRTTCAQRLPNDVGNPVVVAGTRYRNKTLFVSPQLSRQSRRPAD